MARLSTSLIRTASDCKLNRRPNRMWTAWKAIPTLSRMCTPCCSGLSDAHGCGGCVYAANIQQELNEWESSTGDVLYAVARIKVAASKQPGRLFEYRVEHWGEVAGRAVDDLQHLGRRFRTRQAKPG